jgi:hypothetical protein
VIDDHMSHTMIEEDNQNVRLSGISMHTGTVNLATLVVHFGHVVIVTLNTIVICDGLDWF